MVYILTWYLGAVDSHLLHSHTTGTPVTYQVLVQNQHDCIHQQFMARDLMGSCSIRLHHSVWYSKFPAWPLIGPLPLGKKWWTVFDEWQHRKMWVALGQGNRTRATSGLAGWEWLRNPVLAPHPYPHPTSQLQNYGQIHLSSLPTPPPPPPPPPHPSPFLGLQHDCGHS